jgi:hypothetical protein
MANIDNISLAEAVADAKAVINGATVNAKLALEEALTPKIKSILYQKLAEDLEEDTEETMEEELTSEVNFYDDEDSVDESEETVEEIDLESILRELELEEENEEITDENVDYNEDEFEDEEISEDAINEIIAALEKDALKEKTSTIKTSITDYLRYERNKKNEDNEQVMDEEIDLELDEEEDNNVDLDELMNDYKKAKVAKMEEEYTNKVKSLNKALKEANNRAQQMETKLSEINLLNAKLLYANRILQEHSLTKDEKYKMLETIQKAKKVNEVKLVYEVLNERYASSTKNISESLGFASKTVSSTSVKNDENILNESIADRFKILANIK